MEVTELGIIVLLQPLINSFVDVSIIALQLSRESYLPLFLLTTNEESPEHSEKANSGIIATLSPIVKDVRFVQPKNTE